MSVYEDELLLTIGKVSKWDIFFNFYFMSWDEIKNGRPWDLGPGAIVNSASQYHGFDACL